MAACILLVAPAHGGAGRPLAAVPEPVIGLYGVEPESFAEIAAAGFDVVHSYRFEGSSPARVETYVADVAAYLEAAHTHGLKALVGLPRKWILSRDVRTMRAAIDSLKHHAALLAWYEDELGQQGHVDEVKLLSQLVDVADPAHGLVLEENRRRPELLEIGIARMFTYYPIGSAARTRGRIQSLAERFPTHQLAIPFWPVLQAYGQDLIRGSTKTDLVAPSKEELQYTLYSAAVHGASGVFFYTYRHPRQFDDKRRLAGKWPYFDYELLPRFSPAMWANVLETVGEARALLSLTVTGRTADPGVRVAEPGWLEFAQWHCADKTLLLLANGRYESRTTQVQVPPGYASWAVLDGSEFGAPQAVRGGTVTLAVPGPGGVAVLFSP